MKTIKLQPEQWCKLTGIVIIDPDGWDRSNFLIDWEISLTFDEFYDKCSASTTLNRPNMDYDELKAATFDKILQNQTH